MSDNEQNKKDIDTLSGVETTGHEWDGLKELNNPLPRWWVWVWIATIIWSIWYFVVYPAWPVPGGSTQGTSGYTQFKELAESQAEITARQEIYLERFEKASFEDIMADPELYAFAVAGGKSVFKDNCATCHGTGAAGGKGYPNLNDDDWIWGGKIADIHTTLLHGIRADNIDTRVSQMPAFGKDKMLNAAELNAVVDYVLSLSGDTQGEDVHHNAGESHDPAAALVQGAQIFQQQCASCHGTDGKGLQEFGAPNLTDAIWLYGGDRATVFETVYYSRAGMMPAWEGRLDDNTIRQLAVYVHELGGGVVESTTANDAATEAGAKPQPEPESDAADVQKTDEDTPKEDAPKQPVNLLEGTDHE